MKNTKKLCYRLICLCFVFVLAACGNNNMKVNTPSPPVSQAELPTEVPKDLQDANELPGDKENQDDSFVLPQYEITAGGEIAAKDTRAKAFIKAFTEAAGARKYNIVYSKESPQQKEQGEFYSDGKNLRVNLSLSFGDGAPARTFSYVLDGTSYVFDPDAKIGIVSTEQEEVEKIKKLGSFDQFSGLTAERSAKEGAYVEYEGRTMYCETYLETDGTEIKAYFDDDKPTEMICTKLDMTVKIGFYDKLDADIFEIPKDCVDSSGYLITR